ncbi:MAG TPA: MarR family transcriptional regulator [Mycobacteriales bacterium]
MRRRSPDFADTAPTGVDVVERVITAAHSLRQHGNSRLAAYRISVPRARLLAEVRRQPRQRMGALTARLGVTGRTLTAMVDALEGEGLLSRRPGRTDRRAVLLEPTASGRHNLRRVLRVRAQTCEQAVASLTSEERRLLVDLLGRLAVGTPKGGHHGDPG